MVNRQRLLSLTRDLLRIESENPPGNEYAVAQYVKRRLDALGLTTRSYEFAKRRPNIVGVLKGEKGGKTLLLTPHYDVVPAGKGWKFPPYASKVVGNKIYGRGATDCKGNVAAGLEALASLRDDGVRLRSTIIFAATADEEAGSALGLAPLVTRGILKPDAAVILDSDKFNIIVAQKGLLHFKVKVFGKKAHGAYPECGINAIEQAVAIIQKIKDHKIPYKRHRFLKPPTVNIGTIKGGDKVNMVADYCEFEVDIRFVPGVDAKRLLKKIKTIIRSVTSRFAIEVGHAQRPCGIDTHHALVKLLQKTARKNGIVSYIKGSEGATVISFFLEKGIPAVATGFGTPGQAHATDEYVRFDDLAKGARFLADFIKEFDNYAPR